MFVPFLYLFVHMFQFVSFPAVLVQNVSYSMLFLFALHVHYVYILHFIPLFGYFLFLFTPYIFKIFIAIIAKNYICHMKYIYL